MDSSVIEQILKNFEEFFNFLFKSYLGIAILIAAFLFVTFIVAFILEKRTRKQIKDYGLEDKAEEDESAD